MLQIGDNLFSIEPVELLFIVHRPSFLYTCWQVASRKQLFGVSLIARLFLAFLAELGKKMRIIHSQ